MFGGSFFNFGGGGRSEKQVAKGDDVHIDLDVTLADLYTGSFIEVLHSKSVYQEAPGQRECNCRMEMRTTQMGRGQFQVRVLVFMCCLLIWFSLRWPMCEFATNAKTSS